MSSTGQWETDTVYTSAVVLFTWEVPAITRMSLTMFDKEMCQTITWWMWRPVAYLCLTPGMTGDPPAQADNHSLSLLFLSPLKSPMSRYQWSIWCQNVKNKFLSCDLIGPPALSLGGLETFFTFPPKSDMRCILWSYNSNSEWIEWERELSMKNRNDWELWIVFPGDCSRLSISGKVRAKLMFVISNNESPAEGMGYLCHRKNSQKLWDFCLFMIKVQYRDCILLLYRMHRWPYRSPTSLKTLISDITWHHLTSLTPVTQPIVMWRDPHSWIHQT